MDIATDTSAEASEVRTKFLQGLSGSQRVEMAVQMTVEAHNITRSGIADRHPDYSGDDVQLAFVRLLLGDDLFKAARPDAPLLDP
jgi:hypothetical protein